MDLLDLIPDGIFCSSTRRFVRNACPCLVFSVAVPCSFTFGTLLGEEGMVGS